MNCMKYTIYWSILVFSVFLFASCTNEYREHFFREHDIGSLIQSWALVSSGAEVLVLPDEWVRTRIIGHIDSASERIWIEIYLWTDTDILDAVLRAHARWVDVRVLLEPNVYGLPDANKKIYRSMTDVWIKVKYTDNYRYVFTHAKFMIIDDRYYISTGNFTRSFFEGNREFIYFGNDIITLDFLREVFLSDFAYLNLPQTRVPEHMVLSPVNSRERIESMIRTATGSIVIYNQTLTDLSILSLLHEKISEWADIRVCTADNESNRQSLSGGHLNWKTIKKPYLHAKIMILDGKTLFLWSQNFTQNALENNREVGIIIRDSPDIIAKIQKIIEKDCIFD